MEQIRYAYFIVCHGTYNNNSTHKIDALMEYTFQTVNNNYIDYSKFSENYVIYVIIHTDDSLVCILMWAL